MMVFRDILFDEECAERLSFKMFGKWRNADVKLVMNLCIPISSHAARKKIIKE